MTTKNKAKYTTDKRGTKVITVELQQVKLPVFDEKIYSGKPYVRYGEGNRFPEFLEMLANKSALHNAIITSKVGYAYGKGLDITDIKNDTLVEQFINHPNGSESLNDIYRKCIYDYILYGAFALNPIWSDDGTEIAQLYHCGIDKLRSGFKNMHGIVEKYYYSDSWLKNGSMSYIEVPAFSTSERNGSQILYVRDYRPSCSYYSLPDYVGALNSIATDCEVTNFHLSNIKNGMSPSKSITFVEGQPSEEEELAIRKQIGELYTGSDNGGKFMLSFVNDPDHAPKIETLGGDDLDEQFLQLESSVLQQILSGHRVTSPLLVGIRDTGGGLGNNTDELVSAYNLFNNTVIKPIQKRVVDTLNGLLKFVHKYNGGLLKPTSNAPVEFTFSENTLLQIMTVDEMRAKIGLEPLNKADSGDVQADADVTDNQ